MPLSSLLAYMWSQVTVPLSHLLNVLHSLKSSVGSSSSATSKSRIHKEHASDPELHCSEVDVMIPHTFKPCMTHISYTHIYNACVCSRYWTCGSLAYQTWEHSSWMTWWAMCYHVSAHRRHRFHMVSVVKQPGGLLISLHLPFSTTSMVGMCIFVMNKPPIRYLVPS